MLSIAFDYMQNISLPFIPVQDTFYLRQLTLNVFCIHNDYLQSVPEEYTEVHVFSDNWNGGGGAKQKSCPYQSIFCPYKLFFSESFVFVSWNVFACDNSNVMQLETFAYSKQFQLYCLIINCLKLGFV